MIIVMGLVLLVPSLGRSLEGVVSQLVGRFSRAPKNREGFWGGCLMGAALGIVWSPCAGPILATVATVAATSGVNQTIFWMAVAFVLGLALPLFIVALLGQRIFARLRQANKITHTVQQVFGGIIIGMGILMYTGYDVTLQMRFAAVCQKTGSWLMGFEQNESIQQSLEALRKPQE
jgi:cytochrome c biogenesis protein CcdA